MSSFKYDPDLAALFLANWGEAVRASNRLSASLRRTAHVFPLTEEQFRMLGEDDQEKLDAFRVRYVGLQDILANKLFRALLALEEEPARTILDVLNAMEKRGIVTDYASWKRLRDLRNAFMHDDPVAPGLKFSTY
jgi:hypothetical protein